MKKLQAINTEMVLKVQELAGKQAFYENPHLQTSQKYCMAVIPQKIRQHLVTEMDVKILYHKD